MTITDDIAYSAAGAIGWFALSADGESFSRLLQDSMKLGLAGSIATVRLPAQFDTRRTVAAEALSLGSSRCIYAP